MLIDESINSDETKFFWYNWGYAKKYFYRREMDYEESFRNPVIRSLMIVR